MTLFNEEAEGAGRVWTVATGGSAGVLLLVDGDSALPEDVERTVAIEATKIHRIHVISSNQTAEREAIECPLEQVFKSMVTCPILTVLKLKNATLSDASKLISFTKGRLPAYPAFVFFTTGPRDLWWLRPAVSWICESLATFTSRPFGLLLLGVEECRTLQHLSVEDCRLGDQGCFQLCRVLTNCPTISTLSLEGNELTDQAAVSISALIERQDLARSMSWWRRSLRGRKVQPHSLLGLNRLTLNRNPEIGDSGLAHIASSLYDDFWMRAVDMRACGLSETGAEEVMRLLRVNRGLEAFDLRDNPLVPLHLLCAVVQRIATNLGPKADQPIWLDSRPAGKRKEIQDMTELSTTSLQDLSRKSSKECFSLKSDSKTSSLKKYGPPMRKTQSSMAPSLKRETMKARDEKLQSTCIPLKNRVSSAAPTQRRIPTENRCVKLTQSTGILRWQNSRQTLLKI